MWSNIAIFWIFQVEIPWNYAYSPNLKLNGWKLLHLWPTALFGTQNCPIPIGPFWVKIRNLGPHHLLDIITKEKPAKFQIKWTTASKVMRHRNFCAPKRVSPQKGYKLAPNWNFLFSRWRYLEIMCTVQIQAKRLKIAPFMTDRTFWDPKLPHSHRPIFGQKLVNLAHCTTF